MQSWRTISEAVIEKEKSPYLQEFSQVAQGTTIVCLISSHYVSAKTASRTADIAVLLDSKEEKSGVARITRMYATWVAGASDLRRQMENASAAEDRVSRRFRAGVTPGRRAPDSLEPSGAAARPRRNKLSRVM